MKALVTGGSSGIGRAVAIALAETHEVWLTYHHGRAAAESVVGQIRERGGRAHAVQFDAGDRESAARLASQIPDHLDVLVANAGTFGDGYRFLLDLDEAEWDAVWATNTSGVIRLFESFRDRLTPGGTVINLSTISAPLGAIGYKSQAHYATSKATVEGFFDAIGDAYGLRCINLVPGLIDTRMLHDHFGAELDAYRAAIPAQRFGAPEEIGRLVAGLVTTAIGIRRIAADGGWLQKGWARI